jgi:hypothetical protein
MLRIRNFKEIWDPVPESEGQNAAVQELRSSVAHTDPGSGIRCLFDPWIRDPGWVESQHLDPGSGMTNPDHIF